MENKSPDIKTEDILTDESLLKTLEQEDFYVDGKSDKEFELARDIKDALKSSGSNLSEGDRLMIGNRIISSIGKEKRRISLWWVSSAAVLLVLVGIAVLINMNRESGLRQFANSLSPLFNTEYTRLILPDENEIQITSGESKIDYSANGTEINIEAQGTTSQRLQDNEMTYNTLVVPYGKRSRVKLPDNTIVWLNSGSTLIYPARFDSDKREVFLEGEAVFDVSHQKNSSFYVMTKNLDIRVLGTFFNLSAYSDDKTVSAVLESGSVELLFKGTFLGMQSKEQMAPGSMAVYDPSAKTIVQTKVNTRMFISWKDGYFICEKSSLESIIKKLSRYYNVQIEFEKPELALETFSGQLNLRESATDVLEVISEITDTEIEQKGNRITIKERSHS